MKWFASCIFLWCHFCGHTQQQYYETFTPANGLVDARVNKMVQDASGRILFLTRDGISIYDGQRFINHTNLNETPLGIIEDAILLPNGDMRLATFNGSWVTVKKNSDTPDTALLKNTPEVSSLIPINEKEFLVVSNYGLYLSSTNVPEPVLISHFIKDKSHFFEHVTIHEDAILFTYYSDNKHFIYTCNRNSGIITDSIPRLIISSMISSPEKNVFLCTNNGILQLNNKSLQAGKIKTETPWFQHLLPADFKTDRLFFDRQKNIWLINYSTGCCRINPSSGEITYFFPKDGLLPGVSSIFQDNENNYWFIAKGKGVQKLVQTNFNLVGKWDNFQVPLISLVSNADDRSAVFFNNEVAIIQKKDSRKIIPNKLPAGSQFAAFWQNSFWSYPSENILINQLGNKITISPDPGDKNILHYPSLHTQADKKGNLMIAGNRFVLVQKEMIASSYALPYFADNIVTDDQNNYWAFCRSNHIVKFKLSGNKLVEVSRFVQPQLEARFAIHWSKDTFLIATRTKGILIAKVDENKLTLLGQLTRLQGLSNDFVETLLKIDDHRIAAGTAAGLDIISFSGNDTLINNVSARINQFAPIVQLAIDENGIIYARSENLQLFSYNSNVLSKSDYQPGAWITKILVNGKITDKETTSFNYLKNNFQFSVSSPSFIDSRSMLFLFNLTGEGKTWVQRSNAADFEINNLPPGRYVLTITVKYPGNIYADKTITHHFHIRPPFWKTWWFMGAAILSLILLGYFIARNYLQRQLQKQKIIMEKELAIEQERTRMARELHDGLGSMLSGVKHSFSALQKQMNLDEQQENKFNYNIGKLNESIVELRDISHSMASESLLKYGLENSLRDYCRNISQPGEFSVSFEALGTATMQLTDEQSFHIFRIIQELIQNIIKHAGTTEALLQISYNEHKLYITVEDNGKGFILTDPQHKKGIGLKNIESRIKALKGKMDFRTAPNEGTSVLIEIPC